MRRSWVERAVLTLNVTSIVAALGLAFVLHRTFGQAQNIERVELAGSLTARDDAEPGDRVLNFLLVGYDSSAGLSADDPVQNDRGDQQLADAIIVVHLDESAGTAAMVSFPRDLWVEIAGAGREQKVNFAYGVGGAATLIETLEDNFDIPIHHFAAVDFAGFEGLVEAVGSVEVSFPQPARDWNVTTGASQTGFEILQPGCHALDPSTALSYVRSRYYQVQDADGVWRYTTPSSDLGRIIRQQAFLQALMAEAIERGARNPLVLSNLIDVGLDNVTIDQELTPQLLLDIGLAFNGLDPDELATYSLPVYDDTVGSTSILRLVEADAEPVLELFRGVSPQDPSTVLVEVVGDAGGEGRADEVVEVLSAAGFELGDASGAVVDPGTIVIRHGPDGAQAAQVVLDALEAVGASISVEEVETLAGRSVLVRVGAEQIDDDEEPTGSATTTSTTTAPTSSEDPAATTTTEAIDPYACA